MCSDMLMILLSAVSFMAVLFINCSGQKRPNSKSESKLKVSQKSKQKKQESKKPKNLPSKEKPTSSNDSKTSSNNNKEPASGDTFDHHRPVKKEAKRTPEIAAKKNVKKDKTEYKTFQNVSSSFDETLDNDKK